MRIPYESTGRSQQKGRTRAALVQAARDLLARGVTPTVEHAAAAAGISRTTAYRYFPTQRALVLAGYPELDRQSLLPDPAPVDPLARLDLVMAAFTRFTLDHEPQLRSQLRVSLDAPAEQPILRRGRAITWIEDALAPLATTHPAIDTYRLAVAIRSATGIESLIWLVDIAGLSRPEAAAVLCGTARSLLLAAMNEAVGPG